MKTLLCIILTLSSSVCSSGTAPKIRVGADILLDDRLDLLIGKRVGLVTNHTGRTSGGTHLVDALISRGVRVTALFGPEHGIRGEAGAGDAVNDAVDAQTGLTVYSLYGAVRKPTPPMLKDVDVLVYDIQDVGARFYTYISTMALCMEAAAEKGIDFIVLDRPNPLGGMLVDGPVLPDSLRSFVGRFPVPVVYGLTIGELATMVNEEGWNAHGVKATLTVIPVEGWARRMRWKDTGLPWIPPSPNLRTPEAALIYPGTCLVEATNVSEGRGTGVPFQFIGAPFLQSDRLRTLCNASGVPGVNVRDTSMTPDASKFKGRLCHGVLLLPEAPDALLPVEYGLALLQSLRNADPDSLSVNARGLAIRLGDPDALALLSTGTPVARIADRWNEPLKRFKILSGKYRRYPER
jgi:uncharacterized protein YbbC (DUF1343 family)